MIDTEIRTIIENDYKKNHQGREYDLNHMIEVFKNKTNKHFKLGLAMIIYEDIGNDIIEFHCVNGGTAKDLTIALNALLDQLEKDYTLAVTYYDNPRINELLKYIKFPSTVEQINDGLDRTYEAKFWLRSE